MLFLRKHLNFLVDALLFILIYLYLFQYFPFQYLFLDTVITGGDTGSHYKTAAYLKEVLLPQGKIIGWYPGNYGGFPLFIMYFPLLYLIAVWMSYGMPLTISFKIITIIGPVVLPLCTYYMLKLCRFRFPGPGLAACGSLLFLLNTSNSMWGGNLYSTLAGEFSYAISFSLTFVFLGAMYRLIQQIVDQEQQMNWKLLCLTIFLLMLIGTSHGFTLIICCLSVLYFLLWPPYFLRKVLLLSTVFGVGGLLFAGWFVQLYLNMPYTTAFNILWTFSSIWEIIPKILIPPMVLFLMYSIYAVIPAASRWQLLANDERKVIPFLWFIILLSVLCYFGSETLKLPDIRFIPFVHFLATTWGLAFLGILFRNAFVSRMVPFIIFCGCVLWMSYFRTDVKYWTYWNFRGFENAPRWEAFRTINTFLLGNAEDPRVAYEHNKVNNGMGTVRALESLPYFAGRSTLEGLYFQSSLLTPYVFYTQSLYSKEISCPFPDYPCSRFDLTRALDYLQLLNVGQLVLVSKEAKSEARKRPAAFLLQKKVHYSPYEIWKLRHETGYVQILKEEPTFTDPEKFRHIFYHWFRNYNKNVKFLYTLPDAYRSFYGMNEIPLPAMPEKENVQGKMNVTDCKVTEEVHYEAIRFETNCPGKPHLLKVAYNPGWHVKGGHGPYLASPAFMLVYPTSNQVELFYDNVKPRQIGLTLTGIGIGLFLTLLGATFIPSWKRTRWFQIGVSLTSLRSFNRYGYFIFCFIFLAGLGYVSYLTFSPGFHSTFKQYERYYTFGDYGIAQQGFEKIIEKWGDRPTIDKTYYFLGLSYFLEQKCVEASNAFESILPFEDSEYLAEAYYHLAQCAQKQGQQKKAIQHYQHIIHGLNDPVWKTHAKEQLKMLEK
ncbi:MAG: hypothetical protein HQM14_04650 [SAR324 cluster bacterium]|nr:hypothetical protein [SAR324 cluster bacterium]